MLIIKEIRGTIMLKISIKYIALCCVAIGIVSLALLFVPATTFAATVQTGKCTKNDVQCVIAFGNQAIVSRQNALTTLGGKVTNQLNEGNIGSDQSAALQADITTNQNNLASLKTKIDGDTNAQAARQDVKSIYTQFRIFAVVLPRDYRVLHVDIESVLDGKLKKLEPQLQQSISKAPASEQASLNALYSDYQQQLATAERQIDTATSLFPTLTPANYNTDHATYTNNLKDVKTAETAAHVALHQAAKDLHQIAQTLKSGKANTPTPTSGS
jgi:hypothetical protein